MTGTVQHFYASFAIREVPFFPHIFDKAACSKCKALFGMGKETKEILANMRKLIAENQRLVKTAQFNVHQLDQILAQRKEASRKRKAESRTGIPSTWLQPSPRDTAKPRPRSKRD
jgi:hypothetical protein